jgi:hypothetical protein
MKPIEFKEQNCEIAKDQPEYITLPSHITKDGIVISCWGLSWKERFTALFKGKIWSQVMTFKSPLQPQMLQTKSPF